MKVITFFNNKGGVGKTTLVYHVGHMLAQLGYKVVLADLDPQANLSAMCVPEERLEVLLQQGNSTIQDAIMPVKDGEPYAGVHLEPLPDVEDIHLIVGDLELSALEDDQSDAWLKALRGDVPPFKMAGIFKTILDDAGQQVNADIALVDIGPNLGAINRAVLIATDKIVIPVASDLYSLIGIKNLGETLRKWRGEWVERKAKKPERKPLQLPEGLMETSGYVVMQYKAGSGSRVVQSYKKWADRIPGAYTKAVLETTDTPKPIEEDPNCLGLLKHYHSLATMAMEVRKPIFLLKPADGAIGAHYQAVQRAYDDFEALAKAILGRVNAG